MPFEYCTDMDPQLPLWWLGMDPNRFLEDGPERLAEVWPFWQILGRLEMRDLHKKVRSLSIAVLLIGEFR